MVAARKKRAGKDRSTGGTRLLEGGQRRELLALALLALALFLLLALLPLAALGSRASELFPSGNAMGRVGAGTAAALEAGMGAAAVVVPALFLVAGLRAGDWLSTGSALRLGALGAGLILLVAPAAYVLGPDTPGHGWLGEALGLPLLGALGWLGTLLLLGVLLVALCVVTLGLRPLRAVGSGVALGGSALRWGLRPPSRWREARRERAAARSEDTPAAALPELLLPFERETGEEPAEEEGAASTGPVRPAPTTPAVTVAGAAAGPARGDRFADDAERRILETPLPPIELLTSGEGLERAGMDRELDRLGEVLVEKLRTFNVESHVSGRTTGPVVTQFEVVPAPGVKVNQIANLDADLALAMKAQSIRIVAPIPGKGAVGVEIPNPEAQIVQLREILEAKEFRGARGDLPLALGRDLTGKPYVADLPKMPHLLIAGATGSGKSVCINTLITSLVYRHTPETLRLLLIDPKMVELSTYSDLPHLRHPVVTDPRAAAGVLKWAVLEMGRRYELFSSNHVRLVTEFNKRVREGAALRRPGGDDEDERGRSYDGGVLPYIVVVVDELADLMMTVQSEVERPLAQLAQKARAIGIHLIVATQRPSVNVITGLIKANFPARIAFRVASKTDSRTILDQNGAEALLGNGDMLFLPPGKSEPARIQGAFISTEDTDELLGWYRERARASEEAPTGFERLPAERAEADILDEMRASEELEAPEMEQISGDWDELFRAAAEICIQHDQGSTSLLQRRLKIGYGRAARIVDQLHEAGVLGPPDGSKPRAVLVSLDELDVLFPGT